MIASQDDYQRWFDRDMAANSSISDEQRANLQRALGKTYFPHSDSYQKTLLEAEPTVKPIDKVVMPPTPAPPPPLISPLQGLIQATIQNTPPAQTFQPPAAPQQEPLTFSSYVNPSPISKSKPTQLNQLQGETPDKSIVNKNQSPALSGLRQQGSLY